MSIDIFNVLNGSPLDNSLIPIRDPGAVSGSTFIQENINLLGSVREKNILNEFTHGNVPNFLRNMTPITIAEGPNSITYLVMPDVLSIGSDTDYVRVPMNPHTAQTIADEFDCTLPTVKIANAIWQHAVNKLSPSPWGPPYDDDMQKTYRIGIHNTTISNQLSGKDPHALTSGHKKDIVLTNRLYPNNPHKRVAIYGWFMLTGTPIQGLNPTSHEDTYEDYSHGVRLIANDVIVNNQPMRIQDVFQHPTYCYLVSDEGVLFFQKY